MKKFRAVVRCLREVDVEVIIPADDLEKAKKRAKSYDHTGYRDAKGELKRLPDAPVLVGEDQGSDHSREVIECEEITEP